MFLAEIAQLIVFVLFVDAVFLLARFLKYRKVKPIPWKRELFLFLFVSYLAVVFSVLLLPRIEMGITDDSKFFFSILRPDWSYNLHPFRTIAEQISLIKSGNPNGIINLLINSCLFLPFPILLKLTAPKLPLWACFVIPFASILACEGLQYFAGRATDIDDVLLNTAGVLVGLAFTWFLQKRAARTRKPS